MIFQGKLVTYSDKYAIVVSRFNELVTSKLLSGASDGLERHGVIPDNIDVVWVPGSLEIPLIAKKLAMGGKYNAIITLGAIIRGETDHYQYVCSEVAKSVAKIQLKCGIPVIFGVLTVDTLDQAIDRAGGKHGNAGYKSAEIAIEMVDLIKQLP